MPAFDTKGATLSLAAPVATTVPQTHIDTVPNPQPSGAVIGYPGDGEVVSDSARLRREVLCVLHTGVGIHNPDMNLFDIKIGFRIITAGRKGNAVPNTKGGCVRIPVERYASHLWGMIICTGVDNCCR